MFFYNNDFLSHSFTFFSDFKKLYFLKKNQIFQQSVHLKTPDRWGITNKIQSYITQCATN